MSLHYNVDYEEDSEIQTLRNIYCNNPGAAMAICLKANPHARIVKAWVEGMGSGYHSPGYQEWSAPLVQRLPKQDPKPARALKPNERGCEFPFYDQVKSR